MYLLACSIRHRHVTPPLLTSEKLPGSSSRSQSMATSTRVYRFTTRDSHQAKRAERPVCVIYPDRPSLKKDGGFFYSEKSKKESHQTFFPFYFDFYLTQQQGSRLVMFYKLGHKIREIVPTVVTYQGFCPAFHYFWSEACRYLLF